MKCQNCGSELREGVKFCNRCGSQVINTPVAQQPPEVAAPVKGKKKTGVLVGVLVLAILLVCAAGVAYGMFGRDGIHRDNVEEDTQSVEERRLSDMENVLSVEEPIPEASEIPEEVNASGDVTAVGEEEMMLVYLLETETCEGEYGNYKDSYTYHPNGKKESWTRYKDGVITRYMEYNMNGDETIEKNYMSDGMPLDRWEYSYNTDGSLSTKIRFVDGDVIDCRQEYTYDADGNILSWAEYDKADSIIWIREYTYDANGNELSSSYESVDEKLNNRSESIYDVAGNKVISVFYDGDVLFQRVDATYDSDGNMLTETSYDSDGLYAGGNEYEYDADGRLTTDVWYDADGSVMERIEYIYDTDGNKETEVYWNGDGTVSTQIKYTYDADGNLLTEAYCDQGGSVCEHFEYTYDENGNRLSLKLYYEDGYLSEQITYTYVEMLVPAGSLDTEDMDDMDE